MKHLTLIRNLFTKDATFGLIVYNQEPICVTLENPWLFNAPNISCCPEGVYKVVKHNSSTYPNTFRLENVPKREGILIHAGNFPENTQGCILPGLSYGVGNRAIAVANSGAAMDKLRALLGNDEFILEIKKGA